MSYCQCASGKRVFLISLEENPSPPQQFLLIWGQRLSSAPLSEALNALQIPWALTVFYHRLFEGYLLWISINLMWNELFFFPFFSSKKLNTPFILCGRAVKLLCNTSWILEHIDFIWLTMWENVCYSDWWDTKKRNVWAMFALHRLLQKIAKEKQKKSAVFIYLFFC